MNKKVELLSPCGDMQSLKVAVANGADAVYLGVGKFNARMKAENFGSTLKEAVNYCHLFGVKIYVTLNTLVKDSEVSAFMQEVEDIVKAGVDAVILQDLGMATLIHHTYPNLALHASTQMGIHNVEGAKFLESLGFERVVLARETTLEDIKLIKEQTNLEIEYFVQGALCVAFSGNCYLSHYCNGSSGNRGECKQLCRLPYEASNAEKKIANGYYLSPADLCLIGNLKVLADVGVTSFKIEGRLRRPGYVGVATHAYQETIQQDFKVDTKLLSVLRQVFSRGEFNENAYLSGKVDHAIINEKENNHSGLPIGHVVWAKPFKNLYQIAMDTNHTLRQGDGLKIYRNGQEISSMGVGNVEKKDNLQVIYSTKKVQARDKVHLILNAALEEEYITKKRTLPVTMECVIKLGIYPALTLCCGDHEVTVYGENIVQKADKHPLTKEEVAQQLSKLNSDYFVMDNLVIELGNGCFLSKSELNTLRREGLKELEEYIIYHSQPKVEKVDCSFPLYPNKKLDPITIAVVDEQYGKGADMILIAPQVYSIASIEKIKAKYKANTYYLVLPVVANKNDSLILDQLVESKLINGVVLENYYGTKYCQKLPFIIGPRMNVYNGYTKDFWYQRGAQLVISNFERTLDGCAYYNGYQPLMMLCHCPYQAVYHKSCDACPYTGKLAYQNENKIFAIRRYQVSRCYFELMSDKPIRQDHYQVVEDVRK